MGKPTNHARAGGRQRLRSGAEVLADSDFAAFAGQRVGLITNQTGLVYGEHLADRLSKAENVTLAAILGPEHGFRGTVEAGHKVRGGIDPVTGVRVFSLYGATRKPTPDMLRGIDLLVFDIQDIGARFYTYISTMGLAMEAAAEAGIPIVILDRPNPLGGDYVSGFVLEPALRSFVGQYQIPIVHGMSVGELAQMIKGENWVGNGSAIDLQVIKAQGWKRAMRWPQTGRKWVPTSPNIPTFASALVYPGIGIVGETQLVNEGRGMPEPFTMFGAPWLKSQRLARRLNGLALPGVEFQATRYKPRSIPKIAANPLFVSQRINGVRIVARDVSKVEPLEIGIHALTLVLGQAKARNETRLFANPSWFHRIAGTKRLHRMLLSGAPGNAIIGSWRPEVARFMHQRAPYLLYD